MDHADRLRPFHYEYWGLHVAADAEWPDLASFALSADVTPPAPDVTIDQCAFNPDLAAEGPSVEPRQARLVIVGVGCYDIRDGRAITVAAEPGAAASAVQLFLFGSAWGLLCYQRGVLALHAGVVGLADGAIAVCGPSGCGKSTLVAALVARGHALLSDDLCRVELAAGQPWVWPGLPRLKLWRESLEQLGGDAGPLAHDQERLDKFTLPQAGRLGRRQRLRAIYLLAWGEPDCQRLTGASALRQFVAASLYRGEALEAMGLLAAYWRVCAEIVRGCPVYQLRRPRAWDALPATLDLLEAEGSLHQMPADFDLLT